MIEVLKRHYTPLNYSVIMQVKITYGCHKECSRGGPCMLICISGHRACSRCVRCRQLCTHCLNCWPELLCEVKWSRCRCPKSDAQSSYHMLYFLRLFWPVALHPSGGSLRRRPFPASRIMQPTLDVHACVTEHACTTGSQICLLFLLFWIGPRECSSLVTDFVLLRCGKHFVGFLYVGCYFIYKAERKSVSRRKHFALKVWFVEDLESVLWFICAEIKWNAWKLSWPEFWSSLALSARRKASLNSKTILVLNQRVD